MRAVLSSGVALLLSTSAAIADGQGSLRGSASDHSIVEDEEGATVDALSEIFFAAEDGSIETSKVPLQNITTSLGLSANVAVEMARCAQGWSGMVESIAPGCLAQCQQFGICQSVGSVLDVWLRTHDKNKAKRQACKNERAFDCLLWSSHKGKCQPLIDRAPKYGLPASVNQACPRRLDEMPAQDVAAPLPEAVAPQAEFREDAPWIRESQGGHSLEQGAEEATEQDSGALPENATVDAMVMAALSSGTSACLCSDGELRKCGGQCLTKKGGARIDCITDCLDGKNHEHACSECYGRRSDCTLSNCFSKCVLSAKSKGCTDCVHSKCGGDCR